MDKSMRVALVGLGNAANEIHLPAFRRLPQIELVAAAEPDDATREARRRQWRLNRVYRDLSSLLEKERPDLVSICTPPHSHAELALQALAAGAHVLCEKPFVTSLAEADRVIMAARKAGRVVAINNQYPWMPIFSEARRMIGQAGFGRLLFLQAWQLMDQPPAGEKGWRGQLPQRTLYEFGNHVIDLAGDFFAADPQRLIAHVSPMKRSYAADVLHMVTLEYPGGRLAHILLNRLSRGRKRYLEMRLEGEEATMRLSLGGIARLSVGVTPPTRRIYASLDWAAGGRCWIENGERRRVLARNSATPFIDATVLRVQDLLADLERGTAPVRAAESARKTLEIVFASYLSAARGLPVSLSPPDPELQSFSVAEKYANEL
ncbi:MAG: Gfo/Idh/MocA family oxidoreductase [Acidobacteria bacterium]|nr:Gfo/Idh/MocA family oxidoreductase [Acidobacteriota bacterium]MBI3658496.1 Gfo/Idh/MocA family oxidoreductase [Acidobacteriota bacterium]